MPWSVQSVARLPSLHLWRKRCASSVPDEATTRSGPKKAQAATRRNNDIQAGIPPLTLPSRGSRHARGSPERRPARAQTQGYEPCRLGLQIARNSRTHQREVCSSNPLCFLNSRRAGSFGKSLSFPSVAGKQGKCWTGETETSSTQSRLWRPCLRPSKPFSGCLESSVSGDRFRARGRRVRVPYSGYARRLTSVRTLVERVNVRPGAIEIELVEDAADTNRAKTIVVPWSKPSTRVQREVILPANGQCEDPRAMSSDTRSRLLSAIAIARRWMDDLAAGRLESIDVLAGS